MTLAFFVAVASFGSFGTGERVGIALDLFELAFVAVLLAAVIVLADAVMSLDNVVALAAFGAALLGWIAGDMAASDPICAQAVQTNAPSLAALAPAPLRRRAPRRPGPSQDLSLSRSQGRRAGR